MKKIEDINSGKILALHDQGKSLRQIESITEIPKSSLSDYIKRYKQRGLSEGKKGSGCIKKVTQSDFMQLREIYAENLKLAY